MSDRPRDPELEQAIRFARQMSRRRFMVRGGVGLGGLLLAPSLLSRMRRRRRRQQQRRRRR